MHVLTTPEQALALHLAGSARQELEARRRSDARAARAARTAGVTGSGVAGAPAIGGLLAAPRALVSRLRAEAGRPVGVARAAGAARAGEPLCCAA